VIRAVFDGNVLVSGFVANTGAPSELIEQWLRHRFVLVLSEHVLAGLSRVWERPYWRTRIQADEAHLAIQLLRNRATVVVPTVTVQGIGEDEEDDLVLATAAAGRAGYLVTGDQHLQGIADYEGIIILSPRQFLAVLDLTSLETI
jgi:putative PIN family toxin of toxin-antitoxin system